MRWGTLRSWWFVAGLVVIVVALTAMPEVVKSAHIAGPGWLVPVITVAAGVLLTVWKPILTARSDGITARTRTKVERETRAASAVQNLPTRKGRVPRVEQVTDRAVLNIHEAIPLPPGTPVGDGLSADLPEYVTRDVDADLRTFLAARTTAGGFALLVGPAAAGKTRTAYEAVRRELPRWRMVMPSTGGELNELAASGADLTRSVIWLNETQDFLTGSTSLTAATVRRLLTDTARPVLIIGTIWPDRYDQLRTPQTAPAPGGSGEGDGSADGVRLAAELGRSCRDILDQARVFALTAFSSGEWERATELSGRDPRLAQALTHRDNGLGMTQLLSAAPELIHRWEQADTPYGKAVLTAAVTARRCGHPDTLPVTVLQALAGRFLTGTQRATAPPTWFEDALAWACRPVHHTTDITPLRPHAETIGHTDGYRVSDILSNHTAPTSPAPQPADTPPDAWDILITTAAADVCLRIGYAAHSSNQIPPATAAWTRAAEGGDTDAMTNLGALLAEQGDTDNARTWWTRAAEQGDTNAMFNLGSCYADRATPTTPAPGTPAPPNKATPTP
jgi:hypothetical protein